MLYRFIWQLNPVLKVFSGSIFRMMPKTYWLSYIMRYQRLRQAICSIIGLKFKTCDECIKTAFIKFQCFMKIWVFPKARGLTSIKNGYSTWTPTRDLLRYYICFELLNRNQLCWMGYNRVKEDLYQINNGRPPGKRHLCRLL